MKSSRGFTVVELVVVIVLFVLAGLIFYTQKQTIEAENRDEHRKTDLNAIAYALEEAYYPAHNAYPRTINTEVLPILQPELLKDPAGLNISESNSDYRYEPTQCEDDRCQGYTLRALLEREADFVIDSQH